MPSRDRRVEEIYISALERSPDSREAYLASACNDDSELMARVRNRLEREETATGESEIPAGLAGSLSLHEQSRDGYVGRTVGQYKLVEKIGQGGMGSVYLANRVADFEKQVAIKLMDRSWKVPDLRRRFESEIQYQAAMGRHANIVELIDAGETDDRVPYFVMEYVDGKPIDAYCDEQRLSIAQRIELFRKVAGAVQFAHQNTVIHRDLKPGNILVTSEGEPKLIDFGIAKLMQSDQPEGDLQLTRTGYSPMTPKYASPEQIRGEQLSTATDIYSLGVVLFQLLTGHLPNRSATVRPSDAITRRLETKGADGDTIIVDPLQLSGLRSADPRELRRQLAGDLDHIVMMALREEPERRYRTADQLAEDLRRNVERLPVIARPDSFQYRAGKFIQRNRWGIVVGTLITASLVAGIVGTGTQWVRAERNLAQSIDQENLAKDAAAKEKQARKRAEHAAATSESVRDFMDTILQSARPSKLGRKATIREAVDAASEDIQEARLPVEVKAQVCRSIGMTYRGLGEYKRSCEFFELALEYHRQSDEPDELEVLITKDKFAGALKTTKIKEDTEYALLLREEVYDRRMELQGKEHPDTLDAMNNLANVYGTMGDDARALELYEKVFALQSKIGISSDARLAIRHNILSTRVDLGIKPEQQVKEIQGLLADVKARYGIGPNYCDTLATLAKSMVVAKQFDEAIAAYRDQIQRCQTLYGPEHPNTVSMMRKLSRVLVSQEKYPQAIELLRETIRLNTKLYYRSGGSTFRLRQAFAQCLEATGQLEEAERYLMETHEFIKADRSPGNPYVKESADDLESFRKRTANAAE